MATPIDPQQTDAPQESLFAMLKKEILDIQEKDKDEDLKSIPRPLTPQIASSLSLLQLDCFHCHPRVPFVQ